MKYMLMAQLLLLSSVAVAFGDDKPAACELSSESILSRSSSGLAQVTNLGTIEIRCRVAGRRFPSKPGETRNGLGATTNVYKISGDGSKELVPSEVKQFGGGYQADRELEWVNFYVHIQLRDAERDAEVRRYVDKLFKSMTPEQSKQIPEGAHQRALERTREFVYQNRLGHFQVKCRILDGDRVMGVGVVELEVLFKGRFFDVGLPGSPPV
jgi:hypothetical protein